MAAQQPLQSDPNPTRDSKSLNRLVGVTRTRGLKAATPCEQNRQIRFVEAQREQSRAHRNGTLHAYTLFSRRSKSAVSAANSARATELFG